MRRWRTGTQPNPRPPPRTCSISASRWGWCTSCCQRRESVRQYVPALEVGTTAVFNHMQRDGVGDLELLQALEQLTVECAQPDHIQVIGVVGWPLERVRRAIVAEVVEDEAAPSTASSGRKAAPRGCCRRHGKAVGPVQPTATSAPPKSPPGAYMLSRSPEAAAARQIGPRSPPRAPPPPAARRARPHALGLPSAKRAMALDFLT